jgi:alanine racemase
MQKEWPGSPWQVRQTKLEISLPKLLENFARLRKQATPAELLFVLKSDAYGHSHPKIAETLDALPLDSGLHGFGVANVEEGIELRRCKIKRPVYVMSGIQHFDADLHRCLQTCSLTPVISSLRVLEALDSFTRRAQVPQSFHLKFNTGMNRLGLDVEESAQAIAIIKGNPLLRMEGMLSHYAASEKANASHTKKQTQLFRAVIKEFAAAGLRAKYLHMANSAGTANKIFPEGNITRVGLDLYKDVATWTAQVYQIREVKKGAGIGYGPHYRAPRKMKIAVLGVGYGDGYPRALSNRAEVLIEGVRCKVLGAVSMDLTIVDVTKVKNISDQSRALLMGSDGKKAITAAELARHAKTIPWEIHTGISARVPRVFIS